MAKKDKNLGLPKGAKFLRKEKAYDMDGNLHECSVFSFFCPMELCKRKSHFYHDGEKWVYNGEAF